MTNGTKIECDEPEIKLVFVPDSQSRCGRRLSVEAPTAPKPWNRQVLPYFFVQTSWVLGDWFGLESIFS